MIFGIILVVLGCLSWCAMVIGNITLGATYSLFALIPILLVFIGTQLMEDK